MFKFSKKKVEFDNYWVQKVKFKRILNRMDLFIPICHNKRVLHFGCTDYPIFNPDSNLHIQLSKVANVLHGFDIDKAGIEKLKMYVDQQYFSNFTEVLNYEYDICLIPETIEHVDDVKSFLENLKYVNAEKFLITGPNCFAEQHMERNLMTDDTFTEIIHPDHNCWYSPFTLKNVIEKYSHLKVDQVYLLNNDSMVGCEASLK